MERRSFLKALALAPFLPRILKSMDWASLAPEAAAAEGMGGYSCAVPAGSILAYVGESVPPGFLLCDGRAIPTLMYPKLNEAIGKAYGGGRGFLRTPDLQARPVAAVRNDQWRIEHGDIPIHALPNFAYVIKS